MTITEQQRLVRRVLDHNDQQAATTLYYFLLPRVVSALWCFDHNNLEEYTQQALIRIFAKLETWRGDASLSTWACRIAKNVALGEVRRTKYEILPIEDYEPRYVEPRFASLDRLKLRTKIAELIPAQRSVTELRLLGYSHNEVSERLQISIPAVKSRILQATRNLRKAMLA